MNHQRATGIVAAQHRLLRVVFDDVGRIGDRILDQDQTVPARDQRPTIGGPPPAPASTISLPPVSKA